MLLVLPGPIQLAGTLPETPIMLTGPFDFAGALQPAVSPILLVPLTLPAPSPETPHSTCYSCYRGLVTLPAPSLETLHFTCYSCYRYLNSFHFAGALPGNPPIYAQAP